MEFHYDCRYVSSRSTSHSLLAKSVGRDTVAILSCKSHLTSPQKKKYFKICCPWAFGCLFWVGFFLSKSHITPFPPDLGQEEKLNNFSTVDQHSCPTCTGKICPNCMLGGFTNPPELLSTLMQNEWEKPSQRGCWTHTIRAGARHHAWSTAL